MSEVVVDKDEPQVGLVHRSRGSVDFTAANRGGFLDPTALGALPFGDSLSDVTLT